MAYLSGLYPSRAAAWTRLFEVAPRVPRGKLTRWVLEDVPYTGLTEDDKATLLKGRGNDIEAVVTVAEKLCKVCVCVCKCKFV